MDNLYKILEQTVPFVAMVNGKPKLNTSRIMEILILMACLIWFLNNGFEEMSRDLKVIKGGQEDIKLEFKMQKTKTDQRLGVLEKGIENIHKVVFKPIAGG